MRVKSIESSCYEFFLVVSSKLDEDALNSVVEKFGDLISKNGELNKVDKWGRRKFAYPIQKETEGDYVLFDFKSEPSFPEELDRVSRITDGVLRSLIVKKDEKVNVEEKVENA